MATFEQGFAAVETAAGAAAASAAEMTKAARRLLKAAQDGNIAQIRRTAAQLTDTAAVVTEHVNRAATSRPFAADKEMDYLAGRFGDELRDEAENIGLKITPRDEALVCSPSIIRVFPGERAVRVDGKKRAAIRPSKLAADLRANQQRQTGSNPQRFLEALFKAFQRVADRSADGGMFDAGRMISLDEIYASFTTWPTTPRQYTRTDFARDIYLLDIADDKTTKSGATVSFHHSTAARSGRKIFSFVDPAGNLIPYYGVRFTLES